MEEKGLEAAIVMLHHMIALQKRLTMVERCLSFLSIAGHHHLQVEQRHVFLGCSFHHPDAPVDIGRITVTQIVWGGDGEVGTGIEGLMADEHALTERFP